MKTKILIILISIIVIAGGGFAVWYSQIPQCPESCDDGNPCTQDFCSPETDYQCEHSPTIGTTEGCQGLVETCKQYQCVEGECQIVTLANCCGNEKCEAGEDWETCPQDCELCDDGNPCTQDIYSYETGKCSYIKLIGKQPGCSAKIICGSQTCKAGICQIEYLSNCCGNKICEVGETYGTCSADCPNCDDDNKCTKDSYDYHKQKCVNIPILDVICCGNGVCETGEAYENCPRDCPNCDDDNECTKDSYDYHQQKCVNKIIIPCCGNGICDEGVETYLSCSTDCPNCDDDNKLTGDSFNYTTQKCEYVTYYFFEDFDGADWTLGPKWTKSPDPRWSVEFPEDETNGMLTIVNVSSAYIAFGERDWTNYTFHLKVRLEEAGAVGFAYIRNRYPEGSYFVAIFENQLQLMKDVEPEPPFKLEVKAHPFGLNQFHDIKIEAKGNNLKIYVDDNLEIDYTDTDNPFLSGSVGLEAINKVYFDEIIVEAPR